MYRLRVVFSSGNDNAGTAFTVWKYAVHFLREFARSRSTDQNEVFLACAPCGRGFSWREQGRRGLVIIVRLFYLLHLHSPHISMQVMARAENTVFLRVEVKDTNLEIFSVYAFPAKKVSG